MAHSRRDYSKTKFMSYDNNSQRSAILQQTSVFAVPHSLRLSFSPQKIRKKSNPKLGFMASRKQFQNTIKNNHEEQHELESFVNIKKQQFVIIPHQSKMLDLNDEQKKEVEQTEMQPLLFPLIEVKKIVESPPKLKRNLYYNKEIEANKMMTRLNLIRDQCKNSILYNNQKEITTQPSIYLPKTTSNATIHRTQQPNSTKKTILDIEKQMLLDFRSKSSAKLEINPEKNYKKGYMAYQANTLIFWEQFGENLNNDASLKNGKVDKITARSYCVIDLQTLSPVVTFWEDELVEIASLSKIMTCYLSILICQKYEIDIKSHSYRVPDRITETPGTSAQLEAGDILSIEDLLYGLMLPSGNDASICLAEVMGKMIQKHRKKEQNRSFYDTFISHMNLLSKELQLNQEWQNSSGLSFNPNYSTPKAIMSLAAIALKNDLFKKITSTSEIQLEIKNDRYGLSRKKNWRNTNKLLLKGWDGVKTGTTDTAGHCLIAKKDNFLIGVFDCFSTGKRFSECIKLYDFCKNKL